MSIMEINIERLLQAMPHRYPMLLVDRVLEIREKEYIKAIKNVTFNEPFFQGHFPGKPVMPGVLMIEALAQTAGLLIYDQSREEDRDKFVYFAGIDEAKFRRIVIPGDTLTMELSVIASKRNLWKFKAQAFVNEALAAEANLSIIITDK
jgi:3-hydroxyacyl-[acyl-carrier-protein] dehydratase